MEPTEALSLGIFAINTLVEPDASSDRDVEHLLEHAEAAAETLAQLRDSAERLKAVLP
jgi:hypothetical protein